jgi:hypothetical protein
MYFYSTIHQKLVQSLFSLTCLTAYDVLLFSFKFFNN